MHFIIIGLILIVIGVVMLFSRKKSLGRAMDMKYYETSKILDVVDTYQHIKDELGSGNYNGNIVELSGTGHSDSPLIAEFSKKKALYVETTVLREYERKVQKTDSEGKSYTDTERAKETVSSNKQTTPFYLDDGSGEKIMIDLQGAKKDLVKSYDQFSPQAPSGFSSNVGTTTLGYYYKEKIIPEGARLYVLGEATDRRGELEVAKPQEKGKPFIVSTKSEAELVQAAESSAKWLFIGAIALIVVGVGLSIYYFIK